MDKLAVAVKQRSVRLIDFFRAQDRLRSGTIARSMLHRILASALDITSVLTTLELRGIEAKFGFDTDKFYYEKFLAALDSNETAAESADTSFSRSTQSHLKSISGAGHEKENAELAKLEDELKAKVHSEQVDLLSCFRSFDQRRTGRVLKTRFVRCFPFRVPERLVELVVQRYSVSNNIGEIDYSSWLAHLELPAGMGAASFKQEDAAHSPSVHRKYSSPQKANKAGDGDAVTSQGLTVSAARASNRPTVRSAHALIGDIADATKRANVKILDFIVDRDPARCGLVPIPAFESALGRLHIPHLVLDSKDFDLLVQEYKTIAPQAGDYRVDYLRFTRDVQAAQGDTDSWKSPRRNNLTEDENSRVNIILERIRDAVRARRINMFPCFRDFDKVTGGTSGNRTCTANRFARALTVNGIQSTEQETKLLVKYFGTKTPGEFESDTVDYEQFCNLVHDQDKLEAGIEAERNQRSVASRQEAAEATRAAFSKPILADHELTDVLDSVASQVNKRQVRLYSFFSDFDHHKSGFIPSNKFASVLATCKMAMQTSDVEALAQYYAHPTLPNTFLYVQFLDELKDRPINAASTIARAVNGPFPIATKTNAVALDQVKAGHCPEVESKVAIIVERVKECVRTRGILLPPFFCDYDKQKMGLITRTQFVQTLARHPLPLAPIDSEMLATHFSDASVPTHVRWKEFVAAVDDIENPELVRSAAARERAELQHRLERSKEAFLQMSEASQRADEANVAEWSPRSIFVTSENAIGGVPKREIGKSLEALDALFKLVQTRRIRIQQFISAETVDPLRHGICTSDRFLSALTMCGLRMTEEQGVALVKRYATARGEIDYVRFLHDMDEAEAVEQPDRVSHTVAVSTRLGCGRDKLFAAMENDKILKSTVEHIRRVAASRRLQTRPVFEAHDKLRIGTVTEAQFLNSLSGPLTIHLEPRQSRALLDALQTPKDPKSLAASNPMLGAVVAYEGFCSVVDQ